MTNDIINRTLKEELWYAYKAMQRTWEYYYNEIPKFNDVVDGMSLCYNVRLVKDTGDHWQHHNVIRNMMGYPRYHPIQLKNHTKNCRYIYHEA